MPNRPSSKAFMEAGANGYLLKDNNFGLRYARVMHDHVQRGMAKRVCKVNESPPKRRVEFLAGPSEEGREGSPEIMQELGRKGISFPFQPERLKGLMREKEVLWRSKVVTFLRGLSLSRLKKTPEPDELRCSFW